MSHRPTHRPACSFQAVIHNTRNATYARLAMPSKNRNTQHKYAKNVTHAIDSILVCVAFSGIFCVHALRALWFFDLGCDLCRITSVHCVRTAAWKPTFKSVFIGLHALSKRSYATHATQQMHGLHACDTIKKPKYATYARKNNACNRFYVCVRCVFLCAYLVSVALHMTAWKSTFKSFSAF